MQRLFQFKEAAEKYFDGDEETLRQSVLLGLIRARVELCDYEATYLWSLDCDPDGEPLPESGSTARAIWRRVGDSPRYRLTGWFYLSTDIASKISHGERRNYLYLSPEEEDEYFGGVQFYATKDVKLSDLWFEPSAHPGRVVRPEDEVLDFMADNVERYSDSASIIARFRVAANSGIDGVPPDEMVELQSLFERLSTTAIAKAAMNAVRQEQFRDRSKGGKNKAANAKPHPEKKMVVEYAKAHPEASANTIKMRLRLRASERSIRSWKKQSAIY